MLTLVTSASDGSCMASVLNIIGPVASSCSGVDVAAIDGDVSSLSVEAAADGGRVQSSFCRNNAAVDID